jgi:hypothetical protein
MKTRSIVALASIALVMTTAHADDYPPPAPGKIWPPYVEHVNEIRAHLAPIIAAVPPGNDGQASPWFAKLQAIKGQMDQVASSQNQTDLFAAVAQLAEIFRQQDAPSFVGDAYGDLANLSVPLIGTAATHVQQQNGNVTAATLSCFVTMFQIGEGFVSEANWEDRPMPIDAAGVMILDATAVVNQLKAGNWQQAKRFIGSSATAATYFARYAPPGKGLAVLKARYAQSQAVIDAKFDELKNWVAQQEAAAGPL